MTSTAKTALFASLAFILIAIAIHFIDPVYIPARHTLSEMALGDVGWLMRLGFVLLALGLGAAAYHIVVDLPGGSRLAAFLLMLAAFGLAFVALFPIDLGGVAESLMGKVHLYSLNMAAFCTLLAALLTARKFGLPAVLFTILLLAAFFYWRSGTPGLLGWPQRALLGSMAMWVFSAAFKNS